MGEAALSLAYPPAAAPQAPPPPSLPPSPPELLELPSPPPPSPSMQTYRTIQPWDGGQCAMPGQTTGVGYGDTRNAYCCRYSDPTLLTKQDCENKCNADAKCVAYSWKRSYTDCNLYDASALPDLKEVVGSKSLSPPQGHWDANCYISTPPQAPLSSPPPPLFPSSPPPPLSPSSPPLSQPPVAIAAVYLAQTHVLEVGEYVNNAFKLVGGRPALLKVQLTGDESSPVVRAIVTAKTGESTRLFLTGPELLPSLWNGTPGQVKHKLEDSFTATIPAEWVSHGMAIELYAGVDSLARYELSVGAPSAMKMLMFDVYYFGTGNGDVRPRLYPNPILALCSRPYLPYLPCSTRVAGKRSWPPSGRSRASRHSGSATFNLTRWSSRLVRM